MRVLYATATMGWSGGADQVWKLARALVQRKHDVAVACPAPSDLFRRLKADGITTFDWTTYQDYDLPKALVLGRLRREWKADVIHAQHPKAHAMALLASFVDGGIPLVVTRHVAFPLPRNPFTAWKYRTSRVARYVAVSPAVRDVLVAGGVKAARVAVIPPGVDVAAWEPALQARAALKDRRPIVVSLIAHYSTYKGHEVFLEGAALALKQRPDLRFRIAGRDTEELRPLAERLGIADKVDILGERRDIVEQLASTHILVVPSLSESFSLSCVEAQAAGVPVAASNVGGLPSIIEDGRSGLLFPPGDAGALSAAVLRLAGDAGLAETLAARGLEVVKAKFSIEAVAARHEALYQEALTERSK